MDKLARSEQLALARAARTMPNKAKLNEVGLEQILIWLEDGDSQRTIAKRIGVETMSLNHWLHDNPLHSARAEEAIRLGAEAHEISATEILQDAYRKVHDPDQANASALVAAAREIAQSHWRQASVRDRQRYSDSRKLDVTHTHQLKQAEQLTNAELEQIARQSETLTLDNDTGQVSTDQ